MLGNIVTHLKKIRAEIERGGGKNPSERCCIWRKKSFREAVSPVFPYTLASLNYEFIFQTRTHDFEKGHGSPSFSEFERAAHINATIFLKKKILHFHVSKYFLVKLAAVLMPANGNYPIRQLTVMNSSCGT